MTNDISSTYATIAYKMQLMQKSMNTCGMRVVVAKVYEQAYVLQF